ncbi:MAG TPA: phosphatase PAP2 family protein [Jatrophihabitantaceae bacterium]|jgi:hypothetical protein
MTVEDTVTDQDEPEADVAERRMRRLHLLRMVLVAIWAAGVIAFLVTEGLPTSRVLMLLWPLVGLAAATVGSRRFLLVLRDFLPLLVILAVFTYLRGISDNLGMPTWWQPQISAERFLFFGHIPTLWLQEHLKDATPQWWDVLVALVYLSFFVLPSATAAVLWWRNRREFYRWSTRYVTLSFLGFAVFALAPSAPPWAAARCTPGKVLGHPNAPKCMSSHEHLHGGGLIGLAAHPHPGAAPWVERITTNGLSLIHFDVAKNWGTGGLASFDPVAAFPSLHAGTAMLFALFMWHRVRRSLRVVLAIYPLAMTFSLVYSGEHYVVDCLAGFAAAVLVMFALGRIEGRVAAWRRRDHTADTSDQVDTSDPVPEPAV